MAASFLGLGVLGAFDAALDQVGSKAAPPSPYPPRLPLFACPRSYPLPPGLSASFHSRPWGCAGVPAVQCAVAAPAVASGEGTERHGCACLSLGQEWDHDLKAASEAAAEAAAAADDDTDDDEAAAYDAWSHGGSGPGPSWGGVDGAAEVRAAGGAGAGAGEGEGVDQGAVWIRELAVFSAWDWEDWVGTSDLDGSGTIDGERPPPTPPRRLRACLGTQGGSPWLKLRGPHLRLLLLLCLLMHIFFFL